MGGRGRNLGLSINFYDGGRVGNLGRVVNSVVNGEGQ